jgi:hypothetical protein
LRHLGGAGEIDLARSRQCQLGVACEGVQDPDDQHLVGEEPAQEQIAPGFRIFRAFLAVQFAKHRVVAGEHPRENAKEGAHVASGIRHFEHLRLRMIAQDQGAQRAGIFPRHRYEEIEIDRNVAKPAHDLTPEIGIALDGIETRIMSPDEFTAFVEAETARWAPLAKSLAVRKE